MSFTDFFTLRSDDELISKIEQLCDALLLGFNIKIYVHNANTTGIIFDMQLESIDSFSHLMTFSQRVRNKVE